MTNSDQMAYWSGSILFALPWSFFYNSFVKFHSKKFGSHNITVFDQNLCYNEVCYKGTALYILLIGYLDLLGKMEDSEKHLKESSEKVEQLQSKCFNISFYVSGCPVQLKPNIYWAFNSFVNPQLLRSHSL